jgi:hypothetical protein
MLGKLVVVSFIAGACLITGGLLFHFRWESVATTPNAVTGAPSEIRINRWTGEIVTCEVRVTATTSVAPGNKLECE